ERSGIVHGYELQSMQLRAEPNGSDRRRVAHVFRGNSGGQPVVGSIEDPISVMVSKSPDQAARVTRKLASSPTASSNRRTRSIVTFWRLPERMPVTALRGRPDRSAT